MKFPQHSNSIWQWKVCSVVLWAIYMALAVYSFLNAQVYIALFLFALSLLSFLVFYFSWVEAKKRVISLDAAGISLTVRNQPVYDLLWEDIQAMHRISVSGRRSLRILPKNPPEQPSDDSIYAFELGKQASLALERYCPIRIESGPFSEKNAEFEGKS